MKHHRILKLLLLLLPLTITGIVVSAPYFAEDFENGIPPVNTPHPVWSLTPVFATFSGPGNTFELTTSVCHSGAHSLRYNYMGRNGFCNTCGTYGSIHKQSGHDGVDYFLADTDEDLTAQENPATTRTDDGPAAAPGRVIYNKTNGFSTWEIVSIDDFNGGTNNRLSLKPLKPGINGVTPAFNGGDQIAISRMCGVDGFIGGDISRRNDCDAGIIWFANVATGHQQPGDSIWRRVYLRADISNRYIHQKLHYWRMDRQIINNNGVPLYSGEVILFGDATPNNDLQPVVAGLSVVGGDGLYKPALGNMPPAQFERGKWYYIEEEFKAATISGTDANGFPIYNPNGAYRLWFAESSTANINDAPILEVSNIPLPPLRDGTASQGPNNSFWGNVQHWTHSVGSWYMDDMIISPDGRIGPTAQTCPTSPAPKIPAVR